MQLAVTGWVLVLALYGFWGYLAESCVLTVWKKKFVNGGFLSLPIMPFYSVTALIVCGAFLSYTDNFLVLFLLGMALNCVLQYGTSFVLEKIFGIRFVNFSTHNISIHGRVNFYAIPISGAVMAFFAVFVHHAVAEQVARIPPAAAIPAVVVLVLLVGLDALFGVRHLVRLNGLLADMRTKRFYGSEIQTALKRDAARNRRLFAAFPRMRHVHYPDSFRRVKDFVSR